MRLIYHKRIGNISGRNRSDEYTVTLGGKEYFIIATSDGLIIINPDGERLYLEK